MCKVKRCSSITKKMWRGKESILKTLIYLWCMTVQNNLFGVGTVSGIFALPCLIVWADKINKFGWCLAGGRGCWLDSPHEIPSVSWIFHHSSHILDYLICTRKAMSIELLLNMMLWYGVGGTWLIYIGVWVGGLGYHLTVSNFFFVLLYFFDSDSLFN